MTDPIRVLMLEDMPPDAELAQEELRSSGIEFECQVVARKEPFVRALREFSPNIILADHNLPDLDGPGALEIAKEIRPEIPFIFCSGSIDEDVAIESLRKGASDYVFKNRIAKLAPAVKRALEEARARAERRRLEEQFRQVQKMEALGRLAGGVAHDFNNLLTVILGSCDSLRTSVAENTDALEDVDDIAKAGESARALTSQLLAFGRKKEFKIATVDLNPLVSRTEGMLQRLLEKRTTLTTSLDRELGAVKADAGGIEQIVMNLAVNARDAMPDGGTLTLGTANVDLRQPLITEEVTVAPGRYVVLAVKDTGKGMEPQTRVRVFEPFFTTKDPGKGTGLGLSTVHGIVKQFGGKITIDSAPGRGTTFRIYLPRTEDDRPKETEADLSIPKSSSETILLVEDEASVRMLAREVLIRQGYSVIEGENAEEALWVARNHAGPVQLLLTDISMPGMRPQDLFTSLKEDRPDLKVLYMSGHTDPDLIPVSLEDPEAPFIQKPFTPQSLALKLRKLLDHSS